jgi:hypothetical protein
MYAAHGYFVHLMEVFMGNLFPSAFFLQEVAKEAELMINSFSASHDMRGMPGCLPAIVKLRCFHDAQQAVSIRIKLPKLLGCA